MSVMEEFGNNDIGCTSLNVIIPATSYMTCIPTSAADVIIAKFFHDRHKVLLPVGA